MKNSRDLRRSLMSFSMAMLLSLAAYMTEAKAATVAIGPFSSGSGSVALSGFTFGVPFPVGTTDAYAFTLTDNANVSGTFDSLSILDLSIDLNSGLLNLAHTTSHFGFPPIGPFPSIFP